jgi:hypothetical protein
MNKRGKFLLIASIAVVLLALFYVVSWAGDWKVIVGKEKVKSFSLADVNQYGMVPSCYWLDAPNRLLLVPEQLAPLTQASENTLNEQKVRVVNLETLKVTWQRLSMPEANRAVSVQWQIERHVEKQSNTSYLFAFPHQKGPQVELNFSGVSLHLPVYNMNFPPFGEAGWQWQKRRWGTVELTVRESKDSPVLIQLTQTLFNSAFFQELDSLTTWLPTGNFLVISPRGNRPHIFLLGPIK